LHVVRDMKGECGHDLLVLLVKVRRSGARHREPVSLQPILEAWTGSLFVILGAGLSAMNMEWRRGENGISIS